MVQFGPPYPSIHSSRNYHNELEFLTWSTSLKKCLTSKKKHIYFDDENDNAADNDNEDDDYDDDDDVSYSSLNLNTYM